ncbi:replication protein A 32 kDa subunit isoform X2 [Podarcis raffonei]|uniref:replication protein A 32 kDa subunit isoform X2 n=1 Tax=Podarcis raffonei TaxID=65483 RepID=UPI002329093F|nr:replication protein A 32 kDa subunit isoform X2 [Podarcis raffonei]
MWLGGAGGYDNSYGGSGYTQSPGGFASPSATQGERKSRSRSQNIVPCTVSQLLSAEQVDDAFRVRDVELSQEAGSENVVVPPGTYVKVLGHLRSFQNKKSLVAFKILPLEDMNEFTTHLLEVVNAHMILRKGNMPMSVKMPQPVGLMGMGNTSSYGGNGALPVSGLTAHQTQILNLIKSSTSAEGISLQDLQSQLRSINLPTLKKAVEFLSSEGHIYSTIDDEHFKSTDAD